MNKQAVHHIIKTLTAEVIMDRLGVSSHMIRYAKTQGVFPASWYAPIKALADNVGIPCPLSAFNWKSQANEVSSDGPKTQGDAA